MKEMNVQIKNLGKFHISSGFLDDVYKEATLNEVCDSCIYKERYEIVKPRFIPNTGVTDIKTEKLLIISDYPGFYEGRQHLAYVGRTGKFVLDMFSDFKGDIIVMNAVNHYNPNIPGDDEINACKVFVRTRLVYYYPSLVWMAGKIPFKTFGIPIKNEYIYNYILKGSLIYKNIEFPFIGTVNPALVLRTDSIQLYSLLIGAVEEIKKTLSNKGEEK